MERIPSRRETSISIRRTILELHKANIPPKEISSRLNISKHTVFKWLKRAREDGDVGNRPRCGRPRCTTQEQDELITASVRQQPSTTIVAIKRQSKLHQVTADTIRRRMLSSGIHDRSPAMKSSLTDVYEERAVHWSPEQETRSFPEIMEEEGGAGFIEAEGVHWSPEQETRSFPEIVEEEIEKKEKQEQEGKSVVKMERMLSRRETSISIRRTILELHKANIPPKEISRKLNISRHTVFKWLKRAREDGDIGNRPRCGRPRCTTQEQDDLIAATVRQEPSTTFVAIKRQAKLQQVTADTIRRRVLSSGIHDKSPVSKSSPIKAHEKWKKAEAIAKEDSLPLTKKRKTDNLIVGDENGHKAEGNSSGKLQFRSFEDFEIVKILNNSEDNKSISLQAQIRGKAGIAVVMLQKLPFNGEKLQEILCESTKLQDLFEMDLYHNKKALLPPELNDVMATIIYPAEERHILRFEKQPSSFVNETPELYRKVTKPFIDSCSFSKRWIYNILEHKQEADRIVFEDPDPEVGFILVPDSTWTGEQMEDLYLQAIVHRKDITCLRDLRRSHLPLLRNLYDKGTAAIEDKYGIPAYKQCVYLHYQPSYSHLHVHFTALSFDAPETRAGKAHLLLSVISNLEICEDYYEKTTLPLTLKDNHPLRAKFEEKGVVPKKELVNSDEKA